MNRRRSRDATRRGTEPVRVRPSPCLAADATAQHCVVGLLLGAACCPDGACGLCREMLVRSKRDGLTPERAHRALARSRRGLLDRCPTCGFPPPPPLPVVPQLPRLERPEQPEGGRWDCVVCGKALLRGRRTYCSDDCYDRAEMERARG